MTDETRLLEKGSTQLIRNTAATQLAEIQKQSPDSLFPLLSRVLPYLQSHSWDTRTAAAKAIGGIVANAPPFEPNDEDADGRGGTSTGYLLKSEYDGSSSENPLLDLATLDINLILRNGRKLLGSSTTERSSIEEGLSVEDRLVRQKKSLRDRLGLNGECLDDDPDLYEPLVPAPKEHSNGLPSHTKLDIKPKMRKESTLTRSGIPSPNNESPGTDESGLSKRQLNQLKRKNKLLGKTGSNKMRVVDLGTRRQSEIESPQSASPYPIKLNGHGRESSDGSTIDYFDIKEEGTDDDTQLIKEFKGESVDQKPFLVPVEEGPANWPYELMCDLLSIDLFDSSWEIRHGAAMGLREVLRSHGHGAGRRYGLSRSENDLANYKWLNDLACKLLCVLMLDRFGDYVSDTVVAPIRESVGQTLGALLAQSPDQIALSIYALLQKMIHQSDTGNKEPIWQVCHGGMIGLRYLVAVRKDLLLEYDDLMSGTIAAVIRGLGHHDDDVKSVSAATLVPVSSELTRLRPEALSALIRVVWDCLLDMQDDLSASTGAVMDLLANLCFYPEILQAMQDNAREDPDQAVDHLVPRLYYFLRHTITSVRLSVLKALAKFIEVAFRDSNSATWIDGRCLRLIYQNILVERNEEVLRQSYQVFESLVRFIDVVGYQRYESDIASQLPDMIRANMQPVGQSRRPLRMDMSLFIKPSGLPTMSVLTRGRPANEPVAKKRKREDAPDVEVDSGHNTDGHIIAGDVELVGIDVMIRTRIYASRALGKLLALQSAESIEATWESVMQHILSTYSTTKLFAAMTLQEIAQNQKQKPRMTGSLVQRMQSVLDTVEDLWYTDISSSLQAAKGQCTTLVSTFAQYANVPRSKLPVIAAVCQGDEGAGPNAFSLGDAEKIVGQDFDRIMSSMTPAQRLANAEYLGETRKVAALTVTSARTIKYARDVCVKAAVAAVLVALEEIPKKPGQIIKCIMDSVKAEANSDLQARSAATVAGLINHYVRGPKRGPTDKLVSNLAKFTCVDTAETPEFGLNSEFQDVVLSLRKEEDRKDHEDAIKFEQDAREARIMRRGARHALHVIADMYGAHLLDTLPILRTLIETPMRLLEQDDAPIELLCKDDYGQNLVDAFSLLRTIMSFLHQDLHTSVRTLLPLMEKGMRHKLSVIRYVAAKCFATVCSTMTADGMIMLVEKVLPNISNAIDLRDRQGITECVYHLIHAMGDRILPYVIFLIVPILGRMSDSNDEVRLLATTSFATLVKLVPLEAGIPDPPGMSQDLLKGRERERKFMAQMLDPKKAEPFQIPVAIKAELRSYQQDGVNWLAFLNRYNLHGVLCDDMGLGKTLQTLCIVASDHHNRAEEYARTSAPDKRKLPSLIVCPPTLSGHWQQEIKQYAPFLHCVAYVGPPSERSSKRPFLKDTDIVITSYDICRNENDLLAGITWNYCVLDEGHLIKNPKAKSTIAVKNLLSNHRLILSGTPIQNNVLELWSLFDFLMPGFLGTEKVFLERFAKPIAASRNAKSSSKEQEAGALAVEALHKQVLPFLLRRLKEEVLNDLPPKILQNYYCDLSDLQRQLFNDFNRKEMKSIETALSSGDKAGKQHIFQALQYMRKVCNSPALILKEGHAQYEQYKKQVAATGSGLRDVTHAPKLSALRDLLIDCGIGVTADPGDLSANHVSPHRALIFCQMKEMLDLVQTEVLQKLLPSVQYLRLDGSVEATRRQALVNTFNNDPSYDCLLLTTSVGGLGLNLTGADTVIFVEHDWNPQKDIQAMDRAHRLGQKKTVNVYRLITRGTIEEKIMGLQRFKIDVASQVVNQQNAGLGSMDTGEILDLFNLAEGAEGVSGVPGLDVPASSTSASQNMDSSVREEDLVDAEGNAIMKGQKGFMADIGELWDENQYTEEFNLDSFVAKLNQKGSTS